MKPARTHYLASMEHPKPMGRSGRGQVATACGVSGSDEGAGEFTETTSGREGRMAYSPHAGEVDCKRCLAWLAKAAQEAEITRLMAAMEATGWGPYVIRRRADYDRALSLAGMGVARSIEGERGKPEWRLNLSHAGMALRKRLMEQEAKETGL